MTAPPISRDLLDHAVAYARAAGKTTLQWFQSTSLDVDTKADGSPVTVADREAERLLRRLIAADHPDDSIIGEEEPDHNGTSPNHWVLDPVDGTKAFTHGVPLYSTLLAYVDQHGPAIGVIDLPALGETVYAGRGLGCFLNDRPCHVSTTAAFEDAYVCTSGLDNWPAQQLTMFAATTKLRTWGDGYGYALVASGRVDAMVDLQVAYHDIAPMVTILPEAGGRFTDVNGRVTARGGSGLASNGPLHARLLRELAP